MVICFRSFIIYLILLACSVASGVSYVPGHQRLIFSEMDGWVQGVVNGISYRKNKFGKVESVLSVKVNRFSGIKKSDITNPMNFQVLFPGGVWQGVNYKISGTPNFEVKKEYIFLVEKKVSGFYINGLSAGVIPTSKNLIDKISDLEEYSLSKFGKIQRFNEKIVARNTVDAYVKRRGPSGLKQKKLKPAKSLIGEDFSMIIIVLFLILIIFSFFIFIGKNESRRL